MASATRICEETGKRGYRSKRRAIGVSRGVSGRIRAYRCPECHRWHVTHETGKWEG